MNAKQAKKLRQEAKQIAQANTLPYEEYEKQYFKRVYQSLDLKWHQYQVYTSRLVNCEKALYRSLKRR